MSGRAAVATPELRFSLFGHARVEADGAPYPMATPRKTLQVLAYLLLNRRARIARSHLAYLIWPDETDEGARSRLRSTLFDLTRVLPPAPEDRSPIRRRSHRGQHFCIQLSPREVLDSEL
jgi:DNA-binding SARP family transcriptional activator